MDAGNTGDAGDAIQQELLVGVHVLDHDLELVVGVLPGDQQAFEEFRDLGDGGIETGEALGRVAVHRDVDQRHQRQTELPGVEQCAVTGDQPRFLERAYPAQAGRWRQADAVGEVLVADSAIVLKDTQNLPVVAVELHDLGKFPINGNTTLQLFIK